MHICYCRIWNLAASNLKIPMICGGGADADQTFVESERYGIKNETPSIPAVRLCARQWMDARESFMHCAAIIYLPPVKHSSGNGRAQTIRHTSRGIKPRIMKLCV